MVGLTSLYQLGQICCFYTDFFNKLCQQGGQLYLSFPFSKASLSLLISRLVVTHIMESLLKDLGMVGLTSLFQRVQI
jgi:hypothetical protein